MSQPTTITTVTGPIRAYTAQLRRLMKMLDTNPLDEATSYAVVAHIVENLPGAEAHYRRLAAMGGTR